MKLMIVDDHAEMRQKIRELLARPDVEAREYGTGEEAVSAAGEFRPDWIIMDVNLPGMLGFQAAATIRKELPAARVIMVTADDKNYFREAARAVGAEKLLSKFYLTDLPRLLFADPSDYPRK